MEEFLREHWRSAVEIILLWFVVYQLYKAVKDTRGLQILFAVMVLFISVTLLTSVFDLRVISFIINGSALFVAFALIVVFQPEIRSALARLGSNTIFSFNKFERLELMELFIETITSLSKNRHGALFAMERSITLKEYKENGVHIAAEFSKELVMSIFTPKTALHDGGMIISSRKVDSAGCVFPVSSKELKDRTLGLRHRAAIGLSEQTDALLVVVSEETGSISVSLDGVLFRDLTTDELRKKLEIVFVPEQQDEEDIQEQSDGEDDIATSGDSNMVSS